MADQVAAIGTIRIALDPSGLSATAVFAPGGGERWTPQRLLAEMERRGIVEEFRADDLRQAFSRVLERGTSEPFVIAKGIEPSEPTPERARFVEIAIPPDLQQQADAALSAAAPPRIVTERKERVEREKTVTRKPAIRILPERRERVAYTEEVVHRDPVAIDPAVERTGHAVAGRRIGTVEPGRDGVAGRSVTGDIIPARALADPAWYCGAGVNRRGDELFARYDGIIRIGSNWVDIVPFEIHDWELHVAPDMGTCFLTYDPANAHARPPSAKDVIAEAQRQGFPVDRLIDPDEIADLIGRAAASGTPCLRSPLTHSRDASFEIAVSEDKLQALLTVRKGTGHGEPLNLKALGAAIKAGRLVGLDYDKIRTDISAFYRSLDTDLVDYRLAEGTPPGEGPERTLEFDVRFMPSSEAAELISHLGDVLPEAGIESTGAFPPSMIDDVGDVERDKPVLAISPSVPGKPGVSVHGQQIPGTCAPEPPIELFENLERTNNLIVATATGLLHRGRRDGTVLMRVVPHRDGRIKVSVTENRMAALITLVPASGTGRAVTREEIDRAVRAEGISSGIRDELLTRAWEEVRYGREIQGLIFARGRHVRMPQTSEIELLVDLASGRGITIREDGRADFRNQDRITTVRKGTRIARIRPVAEISDEGWDVLGNKLRPDEARSAEVDAGPNVSVTEEPDGTRVLIADIDGELERNEHRFEVRAAYTVPGDVDLRVGNVRFPGSVTVKGSVRSGFYVMAGGDVHVTEMVEAGLVSAEGSILIKQGVKGAGKAVLRAKETVGLTFAEQATILAVKGVGARNSLVHCQVKTNGKVRMLGDGCSIVGGRLRAREGIETHNLGSERGVKTVVEFGQDYLLADRIEREEREMERLKQEAARTDREMRDAERGGRRSALDALHVRKLQILKQLEKHALRVFTYREGFEEHHPSELRVKGTLYPGVVIETHGRTLTITSPKKNVVIDFNPKTGHIDERNPAAGEESG